MTTALKSGFGSIKRQAITILLFPYFLFEAEKLSLMLVSLIRNKMVKRIPREGNWGGGGGGGGGGGSYNRN